MASVADNSNAHIEEYCCFSKGIDHMIVLIVSIQVLVEEKMDQEHRVAECVTAAAHGFLMR